MIIRGIRGTSLIDYPGKVAAVIYTGGCNFRCPFCQNKALVFNRNLPSISQDEVLEYLKHRKGFIDGVVITGGEPTIHSHLPKLLDRIKSLGLAIKLDTNGYTSKMLREILAQNLVDYIAMDIKTSMAKYEQAVGKEINPERLLESISLIKSSTIDSEFRTTCVPYLVEEEDIKQIARLLEGAKHYTLQQFRDGDTLDPFYKNVPPYPKEKLVKFQHLAQKYIGSVRLLEYA